MGVNRDNVKKRIAKRNFPHACGGEPAPGNFDMQLTIELDADQIAHLAQEITKKNDVIRMHGVYPPHILMAMNHLMDSFSDLLEEMDSPFQVGPEGSQEASILADRLKNIRESVLEDKAYFEALQVKKKKITSSHPAG